MNPEGFGFHLVADGWEAPAELLNDPEYIREAILAAVEKGDATLIDLCVHAFSPQGVTATATLAESHIAIHTWPEHGYYACDLFFCGRGNPGLALDALNERLQPKRTTVASLRRGSPDGFDIREDGLRTL